MKAMFLLRASSSITHFGMSYVSTSVATISNSFYDYWVLEVSVHIAALLELSLEEKIEALRLDIPSSAAAPASDLMTA
jgi:hypothetical protein